MLSITSFEGWDSFGLNREARRDAKRRERKAWAIFPDGVFVCRIEFRLLCDGGVATPGYVIAKLLTFISGVIGVICGLEGGCKAFLRLKKPPKILNGNVTLGPLTARQAWGLLR